MKRKQVIVERLLIFPFIATLGLLAWSLASPLMHGIQAGDLLDALMVRNVSVSMFGVYAGLWVLVALASFSIGCWLILKPSHAKPISGLALASLPLVVLGLALFFSRYDGA